MEETEEQVEGEQAAFDIEESQSDEPKYFDDPTSSKGLLKMRHSFGYDCKRLFNLVLMDETLIFVSGNYLHYFHIKQREVTFRESVFGYGFGFIARNEHPQFLKMLTVGENGKTPTVFIYEYPTHRLKMKLEGAAKARFTCGSYNSAGNLLATQGGYPDFMLTIWRWEKGEVVLRSKAYGSDVLNVHFSNYNPILLCSSGLSHIKFWKMANTFTGLKLKGDLGRFGKTDFSDIYSIYMLSDENVISGCEWGNMLLWEAGLIKFEICRKGRGPCHTKPITRITMKDGEVMTAGMDGYVRIWFWETVDLADPPDDDRFVEIDPIYEFYVGNCEIRAMQKIRPFDESDYGYFVQDGLGGIWYCDLNVHDAPKPSHKLYSCAGGKVLTAQISPVTNHLMVLDEMGKMIVYDYANRLIVYEKQFMSTGTDFVWFAPKIINTGMEICVGFKDAVIRSYIFHSIDAQFQFILTGAFKGHTAPVTVLGLNPSHTILVSGSEDKTIFYYSVNNKTGDVIRLQPLGFVEFGAIPSCFNWVPHEAATVIIGCQSGEVFEYKLKTDITVEMTFLTFRVTPDKNLRKAKFVSIKSRIRRDIKRALIKKRKEEKKKRKMAEIDRLLQANPGLQIDLETALADSDPEEEEEPLFFPPVPNRILFVRYVSPKTVWVCLSGFDAGYVYEVDYDAPEPVRATMVANADDIEIHSFLDIENFLLFGMNTGHIRINNKNPTDYAYLKDYCLIPMHDTIKSKISALLLSNTGANVVSIGYDGNIFLHEWGGPKVESTKKGNVTPITVKIAKVEDIDDPDHPSMEQEKIFAELRRQEEAAIAHEKKVLAAIGDLQMKFNKIMKINNTIPEQIRVPHKEMLLDERITKEIKDNLQAELDDVREDMAFDLEFAEVGKTKLYNYFIKKCDHLPFRVKGIWVDRDVYSFRVEALDEEFEQIKRDIEERLALEALQRRTIDFAEDVEKELAMPDVPEETFFFHRDPNAIIPRFSRKMLRLLRRYRSRQIYEIERIYHWEKMSNMKPDPTKNHPKDEEAIKRAEREIGDYKLKVNPNYSPKDTDTLTYKYIEIVDCREKLYNIYDGFNEKLRKLREEKVQLREFVKKKLRRLKLIHYLIPEKNRLYFEKNPTIEEDEEEHPEKNLEEKYVAGCGINIDDILYLENTIDQLIPKVQEVEEVTLTSDLSPEERYDRIKFYLLHMDMIDYVPEHADLFEQLATLPHPKSDEYLLEDHNGQVPWLTEARYRWLFHLLMEQDYILHIVKKKIEKFDADLIAVSYERVQGKTKSEFMNCYLITLNQELYILRDSEEIERQLMDNADNAMKNRNEIQMMINNLHRQVEESKKTIEKLNEQIANCVTRFMSTIKGHKFFDFLRRIFKKKWRPPKPPKVGDESSESSSDDESSSEDEDADAKSIDSTDVTAIRLDEDTCPAGLERSMYDLAFKLRSERHDMERSMMETVKLIEVKKVEIIQKLKKMKFNEEVYEREIDTLKAFRRRRQLQLNKVKVAVILPMSQIQHFRENEDFKDLSNAVLFDASRLQKLHCRVDELNEETLQTKRWFRINWVHLRRMNTDIKFMKYEIIRLEEEIKVALRKKFGIVLRIDELEEEVLRKYIFDLETNPDVELKEIEREIRRKELELQKCTEELIHEVQLNTERLNILTVLTEEKNFLQNVLIFQTKNYSKWLKPPRLDLDRDMEKLLAIEKHQKETIETLEREICSLRMKARPLTVDPKEEVEIFDSSDQMGQEEFDDDPYMTCPTMFTPSAYLERCIPDDLTFERVKKLVLKLCLKSFGSICKRDAMRTYVNKVARYLSQAAYSFEGKITDRILECITEGIQDILPKKYMVHISCTDLYRLLSDILIIFDYERDDGNTEEIIVGIFENIIESLNAEKCVILNKTQYILVRVFKELIEVLPLEEFTSEDTLRTILDFCERTEFIHAKFISIENLVEEVVAYAKENMLDSITAIPIRQLVENVKKILQQRKGNNFVDRCSLRSVASVSISKRSQVTYDE